MKGHNLLRIEEVLYAPGLGGFFYDDQAAIRAGRQMDGFVYQGAPLTPAFPSIRVPAQALGVGLRLTDGSVAWGDMMSVQYSGAGGRDSLFTCAEARAVTRERVEPALRGLPVGKFREACAIAFAHAGHTRLPSAVEYGVSQALLRAAAFARRETLAETICGEFDLPIIPRRVPIYAQSGDDRVSNIDKMILKRVDVMPHGLINSASKFGDRGDAFRTLVHYVRDRIAQIGAADYAPILHFDLYGWIGLGLTREPRGIADFIARLADEIAPLQLHIEAPVDCNSRTAQIDAFGAIITALAALGSTARIVADEWCNTLDDLCAFAEAGLGDRLILQIKMPDVGSVADSIEAIAVCKRSGVGAYLGGSCVETELSAQVSAQIAVATQADMMLCKPGMGVDEGVSIVSNEQSRLIAQLAPRGLA